MIPHSWTLCGRLQTIERTKGKRTAALYLLAIVGEGNVALFKVRGPCRGNGRRCTSSVRDTPLAEADCVRTACVE